MKEQINKPIRFLRLKQVKELTGLSRSCIYLLISKGKFPKQINLCGGRSVAWVKAEIEAWIRSRIEASHIIACNVM